jgi:tetratricopeptide (TPR) repeat protein
LAVVNVHPQVEDQIGATVDMRPEIKADISPRAGCAQALRPLLIIAGACLSISSIASGQETATTHETKSPMQQHYEAAFRYQSTGNLSQADTEYKLFLAMVLHRIANGDAHLGEYGLAAPLYERALAFEQDDHDLQMDYIGAALDASDWKQAKDLAVSMLDSLKRDGHPPDLRAISALAQAQLELGEHQEALEQYKTAAQLHPSFDTLTDLAGAYLVLGDKRSAVKILDGLPERFGDTASVHSQLGAIYGKTKFFDEAIAEFKDALAKDPQFKGVHYSLGASYMMQLGEPGFEKAEAEFRKEIALDPESTLVYSPLGRIAMSQHKYAEAEADFKHAIAVSPQSAGTYLVLGQLYRETGRIPQAEAAFRKAIELTLDPASNGYEVEQAHFWLGRLLIQNGSPDEGRREMDISRNLLYLKELRVEARLSGSAILQIPLSKTHQASAQQFATEEEFEKQAAPVIASSYDNLGVNAANAGDFANASSYFQQAAQWNPSLRNVDRNWGRAAVAARKYSQAVEPLSRVLAQNPAETDIRSMLGLSLCMTRDYAKALEVLQPIEENLGANPQLAMAYAGAMAMAGDASQGLARLKSLEEAAPGAAMVHYLTGEAYASKQHYTQAAAELQVALSLEPSNVNVENALALADVALGKKADALQLLSQVAKSGSADGETYRRLAKLQIELGSTGDAIGSLQSAVRLNPMDAACHAELAEAYRQNAQPEEAEREARRSQMLQAESGSARQSGSSKAESGSPSGDAAKTQSN